jgi:hypothetical protein
MKSDIEVWEEDGGVAPESPGIPAAAMSCTAAQVERAEPVGRKATGRARPRGEVIPIDRWKKDSLEQIGGE